MHESMYTNKYTQTHAHIHTNKQAIHTLVHTHTQISNTHTHQEFNIYTE